MGQKRYGGAEGRARQVHEVVDEFYEEGRQDRCKRWVYQYHIKDEFGISERTFYRYMQGYKSG